MSSKIIARPKNRLSDFGFSESNLGKPLVGPKMGSDYRRENGLEIRGGLQGLKDINTPPPTDFTNPGDGSLEGFIEDYLGRSGATDKNRASLMDKARAEFFLLPPAERQRWAPATGATTATATAPKATPSAGILPPPTGVATTATRTAGQPQPVAIPYSRTVMPRTASPTAPQNQVPGAVPPAAAAATPAPAGSDLIAQGLQMQQRGLVSQSPTTRTFQSGATITQAAPGAQQPAVLQSPYGTGRVTSTTPSSRPVTPVAASATPVLPVPQTYGKGQVKPSSAAPISKTGVPWKPPGSTPLPTGPRVLPVPQQQANAAVANTIRGRPLTGMKPLLPNLPKVNLATSRPVNIPPLITASR